MSKKTYEPSSTKQTLNRVRAESMPFDWSINPYRGCAHGCHFCYARAFQAFIDKEPNDEFQNHILLKMNAAEALEQQLSRMAARLDYDIEQLNDQVGTVMLGTATDPYQPIEIKAEITRECLKVLAKYRVRTSITTRSPLILRDLDILSQMNVTSVNISLNTLDPAVVRSMEPGAPLPYKRLQTVQKLSENGVCAGLFIAPILPYLTDSKESLESLMSSAKEHRASYVMTSLLRLTPDVKAWFMHALKQSRPELVPKYKTLFRGAYPDQDYADQVKQLARGLREKLFLSGKVPVHGSSGCKSEATNAASHAIKSPLPIPALEVEQLSFPF